MPNITLIRDHLFAAIGKSYTEAEFDELCFEFGVEVDDVATEVIEFTGDGSKAEHVVYVIAIPANRYDLLCLEGFARAIRVFLGLQPAPTYSLALAQPRLQMHVDAVAAGGRRPFVVCAALRQLRFTPARYKSFIDLQEKLHQNICRKRVYVAIGTHDLATLQPPFRYTLRAPEDITFVPLTETNGKVYDSKELLTFYREDATAKHLKPYAEMIYDWEAYPVLYDSRDVVMSLPPVINSHHSRITLATQDVFIECTATDLTKANVVLDTVVAMFSEYCQEPFAVEPVEVIYHDAAGDVVQRSVTPQLSTRRLSVALAQVNSVLGLDLSAAQVAQCCDKMQLGPVDIDAAAVTVTVPPTRSDVLHAVDVVEDVAIAIGYNHLPIALPTTLCFGAELPLNHFTDLLRQELANAGFREMLTHGLCSLAENFTDLRRARGAAVELLNPANVEYEVVRTTLIPGALKTLAFNESLSHKDGIRLFEISDVVLMAPETDIGARNRRQLVALTSAFSAGFETIHGVVDQIMTWVQIAPEQRYAQHSLTAEEYDARVRVGREHLRYALRPGDDPVFFAGMCAEVVVTKPRGDAEEEIVVGVLGVVHPLVLKSFGITYPTSLVEINLELLL